MKCEKRGITCGSAAGTRVIYARGTYVMDIMYNCIYVD